VLPSDGAVPVSAVGPTFWWGGTVTDPNPYSLFGQAFLEVQFYPDAIVNTRSSDGGFNVTFAPDKFSPPRRCAAGRSGSTAPSATRCSARPPRGNSSLTRLPDRYQGGHAGLPHSDSISFFH